MTEGFLARWSRLKARASRIPRRQPARRPEARESQPPHAATTLTREQLAALPKIDELTVESDVRCFLQRGVPAQMRNAALRKMWTLDPAIRDFVGHARDYDYDWNTPGGAPGHESLDAREVAAQLRRLMPEADIVALAPQEEEALRQEEEHGTAKT